MQENRFLIARIEERKTVSYTAVCAFCEYCEIPAMIMIKRRKNVSIIMEKIQVFYKLKFFMPLHCRPIVIQLTQRTS